MARRKENSTGSLDSLLDTMTNVVGILVILLVVTQLGVSSAMNRIRSNLPEVSQKQFDSTRKELNSLMENLQTLKSRKTSKETVLERDKKTLADLQSKIRKLQNTSPKTVNLDPWRNKIETMGKKEKSTEFSIQKMEKDIVMLNKQLAEVDDKPQLPAKVIRIPDPRPPKKGAQEEWVVCKGGKAVYVEFDKIFKTMATRMHFLKSRLRYGKMQMGSQKDFEYDRSKMEAYFDKSPVRVNGHSVSVFGREDISACNVKINISPNAGEDIKRITARSSKFGKAISKIKQEESYIRYLVYPDSFEVYLKAREISDQNKISAGWICTEQEWYQFWKRIPDINIHIDKPAPKKDTSKPAPAKDVVD